MMMMMMMIVMTAHPKQLSATTAWVVVASVPPAEVGAFPPQVAANLDTQVSFWQNA